MWICCHRSTEKSSMPNLMLKLSLSHLSQADRRSQSLLQKLCTAPSTSFTQTPSFSPLPFLPQTQCPSPRHLEVPHMHHPTYYPIFSLLTLIGSPAETAPYGSACGRWQHGPLQLHSHGLDPHSAGHQDRQGYGRFGNPSYLLWSDFHVLSSPFSYFPLSASAVCYFCAEPRNLQLFLMLLPL